MEFLEGYPLDEYLKKKGNPTPAQVLRLAAETAAGLAAAHRQGLVHRDVKPGNLWLEAPAGRVKVLDFGLARPVDAEVELTKSGAVVGTPAYMSPEQARGEKVDHRTDLFSLGAVLYRLVTGRLPFQGPSTMAVLIALGTEEPPPVRALNPAVPEPLAELIHQLLAKTPDARPASADEVVKRVRAMGAARPAPAAPAVSQVVYVPIQVTAVSEANPFADLDATEAEPAPAAAPVKPRRPRAVAAGLAALVLAVFGGVIIIIRNRDGSETRIEVPDGATVTVKDKAGKALASVGPGAAPVADDSPDRKAAEWVLSKGGAVGVFGKDGVFQAVADLPNERFILSGVHLAGKPGVADDGLAVLKHSPGLTDVTLTGTGVTDAGLANFKDSRELATLSLNETRVTDAGLGHLRGWKKLAYLNLATTGVTDAGLATVKDCPELHSLILTGTKTTDAGQAHVAACKNLKFLWLNKTAVTDRGLARLNDVTGFTSPHLGGTAVSDDGVAHVAGNNGLIELNVESTAVSDAGLAHFKGCTELKYLGVKQTNVTARGLADFHAAVPGCRIEHDGGVIEAVDADRRAAEYVLSVGGKVFVARGERWMTTAAGLPREPFSLSQADFLGKPVTADGLAALRGCRGLTNLNLTGTAVTDAGLAHLRGCPALSHLLVPGTPVTDAGLAHLRESRALVHLDVKGTKVTARGLADFRAVVPGCRITHDGGVIEPRK